MRNRLFGFVCWIQALILTITAAQNSDTGQTPIVVMLGALASLFVIAGFVFVANFDKHQKGVVELTLRMSSAIVKRLHDVRHMIGAEDLVIVCREAFTVYDTLTSVVMQDKARIFVEYPDGKREEFVILSPKSNDEPAQTAKAGCEKHGITCDAKHDEGVVTSVLPDCDENNEGSKTQIR